MQVQSREYQEEKIRKYLREIDGKVTEIIRLFPNLEGDITLKFRSGGLCKIGVSHTEKIEFAKTIH